MSKRLKDSIENQKLDFKQSRKTLIKSRISLKADIWQQQSGYKDMVIAYSEDEKDLKNLLV